MYSGHPVYKRLFYQWISLVFTLEFPADLCNHDLHALVTLSLEVFILYLRFFFFSLHGGAVVKTTI